MTNNNGDNASIRDENVWSYYFGHFEPLDGWESLIRVGPDTTDEERMLAHAWLVDKIARDMGAEDLVTSSRHDGRRLIMLLADVDGDDSSTIIQVQAPEERRIEGGVQLWPCLSPQHSLFQTRAAWKEAHALALAATEQCFDEAFAVVMPYIEMISSLVTNALGSQPKT